MGWNQECEGGDSKWSKAKFVFSEVDAECNQLKI